MIDSHNLEQFARHVAEQPSCPRWPAPACHDADCGRACLILDDLRWCAPSRQSWNHVAETGRYGNLSVEQIVALLIIARYRSGWSQAERSALKRLVARRHLQ